MERDEHRRGERSGVEWSEWENFPLERDKTRWNGSNVSFQFHHDLGHTEYGCTTEADCCVVQCKVYHGVRDEKRMKRLKCIDSTKSEYILRHER